MAENSKTPKSISTNKQGELKNHARGSSPSFNIGNKLNNNRQNPSANQNLKTAVKKKLLTEGIKKGAQAYGVPEVATEQVLNSEFGQEVLDAAASAPSVTSGVNEASKVIFKRTVLPPLLIGTLAPFLLILLFFAIIFSKDAFGGVGDGTDVYEELRDEISSVVSKYSSKVEIDGNLILATLIAYKSLDDSNESLNMSVMVDNVEVLAKYQIMTTKTCYDDSSTIRKIAANDSLGYENTNCVSEENILNYSLSINEGKMNDDNSGSVYYWNLIDEDFIFDYYNEYMINKEDNTSENNRKIEDIISEIYSYYKDMDKLEFSSYGSICTSGITVDGVTMDFEQYIKGVLKSELGWSQTPLETLKALAVAARSYALTSTENCTREITNSTAQQTYKEYIFGLDNPNIEIAVNETKGEILILNGEVFKAFYSTFPKLGNSKCATSCNSDSCQAQLFYDWNGKLGSHVIEIPRNIGFPGDDVYDYATGLSRNIYGHCSGMSQIGAWYDANNGMTYDKILEKYYSNKVNLETVIDEGLVDDGTGYLKRLTRPERENGFYYNQTGNNYGLGGTLEGECSWYAAGRAKEILAELNSGQTWSYSGNGGNFCDNVNYDRDKFVISRDYTKPLPGAIVSWKSSKYGHVAIVESVEGNTVTVSEAALAYGPTTMYGCGPFNGDCVRAYLKKGDGIVTGLERKKYCEADGSGCFRTKKYTIQEMSKKGTFQCYIYLTQPK